MLLLSGLLSAPLGSGPGSGTCLEGAEVYYVGFSEMRHMLQSVEAEMGCSATKNAQKYATSVTAHQGICSGWNNVRHHYTKMAHGYGPFRDSLCREALYSEKPFQMHCNRSSYPSFTVSYEWKSFAYSQRDLLHKQRVLAAARTRPFVMVLLSVGAHHFTKLAGHRYESFHAVEDDMPFRQEWINNYMNETLALLELFSRESLPDNVCVVWKANNVGMRVHSKNRTISSIHHPSAFNGIHHWMNRFTQPLAARYGVGYVDLTDLTS
eukprot:5238517-Prymnesium_polylepis.1